MNIGGNNFSGPSTLTEGTLVLDQAQALGYASPYPVFNFNGGALEAGNIALTGTNAIQNPVTIGGTAVVGLNNAGGYTDQSIQFNDAVTLGASRTLIDNLASRPRR